MQLKQQCRKMEHKLDCSRSGELCRRQGVEVGTERNLSRGFPGAAGGWQLGVGRHLEMVYQYDGKKCKVSLKKT